MAEPAPRPAERRALTPAPRPDRSVPGNAAGAASRRYRAFSLLLPPTPAAAPPCPALATVSAAQPQGARRGCSLWLHTGRCHRLRTPGPSHPSVVPYVPGPRAGLATRAPAADTDPVGFSWLHFPLEKFPLGKAPDGAVCPLTPQPGVRSTPPCLHEGEVPQTKGPGAQSAPDLSCGARGTDCNPCFSRDSSPLTPPHPSSFPAGQAASIQTEV